MGNRVKACVYCAVANYSKRRRRKRLAHESISFQQISRMLMILQISSSFYRRQTVTLTAVAIVAGSFLPVDTLRKRHFTLKTWKLSHTIPPGVPTKYPPPNITLQRISVWAPCWIVIYSVCIKNQPRTNYHHFGMDCFYTSCVMFQCYLGGVLPWPFS